MNRKNNTLLINAFAACLLLTSIPADIYAQDAVAILEKMDRIIFGPKDRQGKITIILIDKSGKEKVREATMHQKGADKKLYRYTKPESQAGIATLSLPNDETWLYMPAFEKPKRISMLAKSESFNNTDFSYEDMAPSPYSERFTPELIKTSGDLYLLSLIPKSGKSSYSKIIARVNIQHGYPVQMDYYDVKGKKIKESNYRYEKVGPYWNASEVTMTDMEKEHTTRILLSDMKFDTGLSDDLFRVENIKTAGLK